MKHRFGQNWGIAARLLAIVVLPASLMFTAVVVTLYLAAQRDVRRDVASRGQLVATALAQSSQYGLMSGNAAYLRTTLRHLLEADPSIACIDIADVKGVPLVSDCQAARPREVSVFEVPVRVESLPDLDVFDALPPQNKVMRTVGQVRVTMSPAPIFAAKQRALLVAFALVLAAAVASCLIGLRLARRLRDTLGSVMAALRDVRQGRFDVQLATNHEGELGELQRTIVQMAGTLDASRHDLEQQVAKRTRQLQEAVDLARQADADKRRLIVRSNALVEEERRRIALDLHDHLGASLISVRLQASALVARARACGDAEMQGDAARIAATAQSIYATTRDIVKRLRPEVIDTLGLAGAVEELVRHADQVHPVARFTFQVEPGFPDVRGELAMPAYRVAQEALNNIAKHSDATLTSVTLSALPETGHLRMVIQDNGRGFDTRSSRSTGIGLIGMRERVAAVGGELLVSSTPGQGTTVCVTLPLPASH